jgi:hypothetical protein
MLARIASARGQARVVAQTRRRGRSIEQVSAGDPSCPEHHGHENRMSCLTTVAPWD